VNRLDAFMSRASRQSGPDALRAAFVAEFGQSLGGALAEGLFDDYEAGLDDRADPEARLAAFASLASMDYDESFPLSGDDWRSIGRTVSDCAGEADMGFVEYALALVLEKGGL
jgi:hypothetical protein